MISKLSTTDNEIFVSEGTEIENCDLAILS